MSLQQRIFSITNENEFEKVALEVFQYQYQNNAVYNEFCTYLNKDQSSVKTLKDIPFLPIEFFKTNRILDRDATHEEIFTSSGTTGSLVSKHYVKDLHLYEQSFLNGFEQFYGKLEDYAVLALLPAYLERKGSSLVYMANDFIKKSKYPESGFYLNNLKELTHTLQDLEERGIKTLLIGVSFALLDLAEKFPLQLKNTIVMETGGMKGRRKEMIRTELHEILAQAFQVDKIHSEYGMTELLSQAYSKGQGIFSCPSHMHLLIRDPEDALSLLPQQKTGGINVIDLANLHSCSFIATQDLGKQIGENEFEILGRFDASDIRGCNLMLL
ncbi:acyl transferase [Mesonia ostreae]|uniref:Acyl transferase n=1 Tax=Mesonia ostreae TaxID=861110 RepID=A0ABU2KHG3_9FLAO|nr:acyl transferase [Mesonia ostreae]MDT0294124.1 acyl transferase [Mesonia ostreae]